jgi:hypothetical protein
LAAAGVLALVACSSTKRTGEDPQRSSSAAGEGTADQPNSCGAYVGDAELPEQHGGMAPLFEGDLTKDSPPQNGRFGAPFTLRDNDGWTAHSCDTPNPKPTTADMGRDIRYDELFFKNWTDSEACISVYGHLYDADSVAMNLQFGAYVGGYDPALIEVHNVGAGGGDFGFWVAHYAFKVPAHTDFEIVVSAEAPYSSDGTKTADVDVHWQLQVSNCGEPGTGGSTSSSSSSSSSSGPSGSSDDAGTGTGKTW